MSTTHDTLIGVTETARRLSLSPHTVRKYVELRRIPFVKIGRKVLFDPADLDAFVTERKVPVQSLSR